MSAEELNIALGNAPLHAVDHVEWLRTGVDRVQTFDKHGVAGTRHARAGYAVKLSLEILDALVAGGLAYAELSESLAGLGRESGRSIEVVAGLAGELDVDSRFILYGHENHVVAGSFNAECNVGGGNSDGENSLGTGHGRSVAVDHRDACARQTVARSGIGYGAAHLVIGRQSGNHAEANRCQSRCRRLEISGCKGGYDIHFHKKQNYWVGGL